ncbi:DEAD-box ATP-dependent RNA helicase chloroplastic-like [Quillaja saponaria]|uniref:DEAD-box ATP-dependent RNA helicase chloroplastic-like n=1 Tax=Quillaja saponaria TaxID=32244 RepID=A0AAD7PG65_QUISA|nr:DEAD-box ATP-dependent RNA helicase chloroplastic-like [Quillaja saponaria]
MGMLLDKEDMKWYKISDSEVGGLWSMEGSPETWSWSINVPVLSSLSENDELLQKSQEYHDAVELYKQQRTKVACLKKKISRTEGFKEYKKILDMAMFTEEKIKRLKARSKRLNNRIKQIEPSGWKEFLQSLLQSVQVWFPEGIKVPPWRNNSYIYEPSTTVVNLINFLDEQRSTLLHLQEKHRVTISCCLDSQFGGMVEAWASGLTWREMMMDCAMDNGDLARLLRQTIDLLAQIPKLPDIDPLLQSNAMTASNVMDRPPISELAE